MSASNRAAEIIALMRRDGLSNLGGPPWRAAEPLRLADTLRDSRPVRRHLRFLGYLENEIDEAADVVEAEHKP